MLFSIAIIVLLIIFPKEASQGAIGGLRMCATAVIPALFPFFVATRLLPEIKCRALSKFCHIPEGSLSALLVSFLGGYPIGVARVCSMYEDGIISKHEAQQAIVFCNNSGPGFFVGMLGGYIFQDTVVGLVLYAIHILSAILCTYLFQPQAKSFTLKRVAPEKKSFAQNFTQAISASCETMLNISALVVLFSIFISILNALKLFSALPLDIQALLFGALELTSGIALTKNAVNGFVICAFLMGWGGLCVHLQAMSIWKKQGLCIKNYLPAKLLHGLLSALLALSLMNGISIFIIVTMIFIIICGILRNFIKFGVEKRKDLLYNTSKR